MFPLPLWEFAAAVASVGIDNPTIEVRFEHLNINAEAFVGNRGVPTLVNFFVNKAIVRSLLCSVFWFSGRRSPSFAGSLARISRLK